MVIQYIRSHSLSAGDRLPSEREFTKMFRTNRVALRNSFNGLEMAGIIYRKHGSGTFVAHHSINHMLDVSRAAGALGLSPQLIVEARLTIEPAVVALSARKANDDDINLIQRAFDTMAHDFQNTGTFSIQHDREFHKAVAYGAHNPLLETILNYLYVIDEESPWVKIRNEVMSGGTVPKEFLQEHQAIIDAIQRRKPRTAQVIVEQHTKQMELLISERMPSMHPESAGSITTEKSPDK